MIYTSNETRLIRDRIPFLSKRSRIKKEPVISDKIKLTMLNKLYPIIKEYDWRSIPDGNSVRQFVFANAYMIAKKMNDFPILVDPIIFILIISYIIAIDELNKFGTAFGNQNHVLSMNIVAFLRRLNLSKYLDGLDDYQIEKIYWDLIYHIKENNPYSVNEYITMNIIIELMEQLPEEFIDSAIDMITFIQPMLLTKMYYYNNTHPTQLIDTLIFNDIVYNIGEGIYSLFKNDPSKINENEVENYIDNEFDSLLNEYL